MRNRAAIVGAGDVGGTEHADDTGEGANPFQRDAGDAAMRNRRQAKRGVQRPGEFGQIVDVGCFTGNMQMSRFVRLADADARVHPFRSR